MKPTSLDASSLVISRGLHDLSTSFWVSHLTATCGSYLFVTSSPMTNHFPIGLALKGKKNCHHPRKVPVFSSFLRFSRAPTGSLWASSAHANIRAAWKQPAQVGAAREPSVNCKLHPLWNTAEWMNTLSQGRKGQGTHSWKPETQFYISFKRWIHCSPLDPGGWVGLVWNLSAFTENSG